MSWSQDADTAQNHNKLKVYLGLGLYIYRPSLVLLSPGLAVYTFTPEQSDK